MNYLSMQVIHVPRSDKRQYRQRFDLVCGGGRSVRSVSGLLSRSAGFSRILWAADTISAAEGRFCAELRKKERFYDSMLCEKGI